ncbi:MAG: TonB family protein [Acidobacteria bacterium]|nr:TonB family protein [Acidobacteriota bacterium]
MKKIFKKILKFRIDFRQAVLLAILIHLFLFFLPDADKFFLPLSPKQTLQQRQVPDEMDFKFVEIPNDKSEPNPDARQWSDKDRRAATPEPEALNPDAIPEPKNKGENPEAMLSKSQIMNPSSRQPSKEDQKEESEEKYKVLDDSIRKRLEEEWSKEESVDKKRAEELQEEAKRSNSEYNLSLEDMSRQFDFQDFNNPRSSIDREGGIQFDSKGCDFGRWVKDFYYKVYRNWTIPYAFQALRQSGQLTLRFYVHRDGSVSDLRLIDTSGLQPYDVAAMNAISRSNPFMPLPGEYPDDKMEVTCRFIYRWRPRR